MNFCLKILSINCKNLWFIAKNFDLLPKCFEQLPKYSNEPDNQPQKCSRFNPEPGDQNLYSTPLEQLSLWLLWELLLWSLPVRIKTFVMWVRIMFGFHHHHGESPCVTLFVAPIVTQSRPLTSSIKTFVLEDGSFFSLRFTVTVLTEEFGAFYRQQNSSHEQTISLLGSRGARVGVQCTWCT